mmetsp:Transcript_9604/g.14812  ORF Transcript_9604/g.14812 Transcript_9604/m.14812 type:complete len:248 (+) Transcript_9604:40-783(+)
MSRRLTIFLLCLFCTTVKSFSPSCQLKVWPCDSRLVSLRSGNDSHNRHPRLSSLILRLSDNEEGEISVVQRVRVLSYRLALAVSALFISELALVDSQFLEGTGLNLDDSLSRSCLPVAAGLSLVLGPAPQGAIKVGTTIFGATTIAVGIASNVLSSTEDPTLSNLAWKLWVLSLMVVSIREIWYFGGEYKRECGITLFMLPLMLDPNTIIPLTIPLCALGMDVLAAGKVFEPCEEDLKQTQSEFLTK